MLVLIRANHTIPHPWCWSYVNGIFTHMFTMLDIQHEHRDYYVWCNCGYPTTRLQCWKYSAGERDCQSRNIGHTNLVSGWPVDNKTQGCDHMLQGWVCSSGQPDIDNMMQLGILHTVCCNAEYTQLATGLSISATMLDTHWANGWPWMKKVRGCQHISFRCDCGQRSSICVVLGIND